MTTYYPVAAVDMSNKAKGSSLQAGERFKLKQGGGARSAAVKGIQPATIKKVPVLHRSKDLTATPAHTHYDSDSFPGDSTGLSKSATVTRLERELVVSSEIPPYGSEVFHSCFMLSCTPGTETRKLCSKERTH